MRSPSGRSHRRLTAPSLRVGLLAFAFVLAATPVLPHALAPALLEVQAIGDGLVDVRWKTSRQRPRGARIEPRLPAGCDPVGETGLEEDTQSVTLVWQVACPPGGLVGRTIGVDGLGTVAIDVLVRVTLEDGRVVSAVLTGANDELMVPRRQGQLEVFGDYLRLGFGHILGGPDHLLFVLGLLLLIVRARPLIQTITAFTLGHSITLSLVTLDIARVPSGPVEFGIALSVLALAVELATPTGTAQAERRPPSLLRRRPWLMAAGFGLLHGLGFAGALAEIGLPQEAIPMALFSFNVGIELGQVAFICAIALVVAPLRRPLAAMPGWIGRVPAYGIGTLAAFWCYERAADLW